ncbi:MAG: hypothetical protein AAGI48_16640 [Verrucomicrobiota bacterium]
MTRLGSSRNIAGLILMLAAVGCFILFHFAQAHGLVRGWHLWTFLAQCLSEGTWKEDTYLLLGFSGFITLTITTLAAPLTITWLLHSTPTRWFLILATAMASGSMWYLFRDETYFAMFLLALTPTLTLAGLLCLKSPTPGPPPPPEAPSPESPDRPHS